MKPFALPALLALLATAPVTAQEPPKSPQEAPPDTTQRKYATLVVEVKDEEGKALEGASVSVDHAGGTRERAGTTGQSGFVQLLLVPAGHYFVRIRLRGFAPEEQPVHLEADHRADLVFTLRKAKA
ncbi:MAG: carboxypeptidase-like regulatory domain-containing protein [Holophagaceae bacterium]